MIKNQFINLERTSTIRVDALNTIKYTLLLDYSVPVYKDDSSFIFDVMERCQNCCADLFVKLSPIRLPNYSIDLFGAAINTSYGKMKNCKKDTSKRKKCEECKDKTCLSDKCTENHDKCRTCRCKNLTRFIDTTTMFVISLPQIQAKSYKEFLFSPHIDNMILQHCVISCYHAILTSLKDKEFKTLYEVINAPHLGYLNYKSYSEKSNSKKSAIASDFLRTTQTHIKYLDNFSEIILAPNDDVKGYRVLEPFSELWYSICTVPANKFDNLYHAKKSNTITSTHTDTLLANVIGISNTLMPKMRNGKFTSSPSDSLYQCYLNERIFNLRLFYTLYKAIEHTNKEGFYRIDQGTFISAFNLLKKLPNVFSRQSMLIYAISHINPNVYTSGDFWRSNNLSTKEILSMEARTIKREFNLHMWKNQLELFINYFSEYVIPIYEWCFMNMLLESIEERYPQNDHKYHLGKALDLLKGFLNEHYQSFLQPLKLRNDSMLKNITDIISPIDSFLSSDKVDRQFVEKLFSSFFNTSFDINLNLSLNLTPGYFKANIRNDPTAPINHVRQFYIDFLRYRYWEENLPKFKS